MLAAFDVWYAQRVNFSAKKYVNADSGTFIGVNDIALIMVKLKSIATLNWN